MRTKAVRELTLALVNSLGFPPRVCHKRVCTQVNSRNEERAPEIRATRAWRAERETTIRAGGKRRHEGPGTGTLATSDTESRRLAGGYRRRQRRVSVLERLRRALLHAHACGACQAVLGALERLGCARSCLGTYWNRGLDRERMRTPPEI